MEIGFHLTDCNKKEFKKSQFPHINSSYSNHIAENSSSYSIMITYTVQNRTYQSDYANIIDHMV